MLKFASWNIKDFDDCFDKENNLKTDQDSKEKLDAIAEIMKTHLDADFIGIMEGPNTTVTSGGQDGEKKLENFANAYGLRTNKALQGFKSAGKQEILALYDENKLSVEHKPGGNNATKSNPRFDGELYFDADDDKIKEVYKHYRPPLELKITTNANKEFWVMIVHAKSKGIFNSVDQVHLERLSRRNRLKLYAECNWIRRRVDDWLEEGKQVMVMGDMNDGPGMDVYEQRYGRSAVEVLMGDIFYPHKLLVNYLGRPKWTNRGWDPASARFKDRITETYVNVLIDHILVSQNVPVVPNSNRVWNPYQTAETDPINGLGDLFTTASDHFPVTLEVSE